MLIFHCNWQHVFQKFCSHLLGKIIVETLPISKQWSIAKLMLSLEICSDKVEENLLKNERE